MGEVHASVLVNSCHLKTGEVRLSDILGRVSPNESVVSVCLLGKDKTSRLSFRLLPFNHLASKPYLYRNLGWTRDLFWEFQLLNIPPCLKAVS